MVQTKSNPKGGAAGRSRWSQAVLGIVAAVMVGVVGFYVLRGGAEEDASDQAQTSTAQGSTDSDESVRILSGSAHTVRHSTVPLPSGSQPQADGLPTLVWFSGTWCTFCRQMEDFAFESAGEFEGQVHFVEKSVDHDTAATNRYAVRGTPTFVLIDARGEEIARFGFQSTPAAFESAITEALKKVPA